MGKLKIPILKRYWCGLDDCRLAYPIHATDKAANELYDIMYEKLSSDERFKRTGDYIKDVQLENEKKRLIEEEILNEIIYVY